MKNMTEKIKNLSHWDLKDNYIERVIVFNTFQEALQMMVTIGKVCDELNHHPDWTNVYTKLTIKLTTHDSGTVTQKDIELATRINELLD
jgi:4a-hydroxytetrahydrobiopterin dehydratase